MAKPFIKPTPQGQSYWQQQKIIQKRNLLLRTLAGPIVRPILRETEPTSTNNRNQNRRN